MLDSAEVRYQQQSPNALITRWHPFEKVGLPKYKEKKNEKKIINKKISGVKSAYS